MNISSAGARPTPGVRGIDGNSAHRLRVPSLAGPGFWARPEIRLYYTYASWNAAPLSDSGAFGNAQHGSNFGVQVEYWW